MFLYGIKISSSFFIGNYYFCDFKYGIYWSVFMFFLLLEERSHFTEIINLSIFKKFGKYSFGIYLFHYEGFRIVNIIKKNNFMNKSNIEIIIIELFFAFIFGMIFFHFVENPSMKFGNYLIKKLNRLEDDNLTKKRSWQKIILNFLLFLYFFLIFFFIFRHFNLF